MALLVFFVAFLLAATAVHAAGQEGFLSIDCGVDDAYSDQQDKFTHITYVSDGPYVDSGEKHKIAAGNDMYKSLQTLRSFSSGAVRNCYTLPTKSGAKYLVRVEFLHGSYDGTNSPSSVQFDLHLGTNYWRTVTVKNTSEYMAYEAVFAAWASWVPVCLLDTNSGTPFVSTVELRPLDDWLYPDVNTDQHMSLYDRKNFGTDAFTRFHVDPYDRYWWAGTSSSWENLSTQNTIAQQDQDSYSVPNNILQTAITTVSNGTVLTMQWAASNPSFLFRAFLHFADFQKSQLRQFDVYINDERLENYSPMYLKATSVKNSGWSNTTDGYYNITLAATSISVLPPMINAYEIYTLIPNGTSRTFSKDFDALMAIKYEYGVKKNWNGDPCFPEKYVWNGVKCSNSSGNTARIISLDLSNSNLNGSISANFTLLTQLQFLNLSANNLNGPIPDSFCKRDAGSLVFRYEFGEDMCNKTISPPPPRKITTIISISIVVPIVVVSIVVLSYLIWRGKRNPKISVDDPPRKTEPESAPRSTKSNGEQLQNTENRQFTYKELEKFTNNFGRFLGQGGFGLVYYGRLEDGSDVAVKMRSESSSHGLDEFIAEVNSLTKVHHRNLVSLVGYCWETEHLALVYEYMSRGNLWDHLRGKNDVETLDWATRVRVVLEAAQGLDYLHKGCSFPIIHRDVKSGNILLGQNLRAKVADFGLCKTYISETQTHISTNAAGTAGYFDPEYFHTGRLTESSDVYSFGVVLLEIATGEPPILPGSGHIVQRVKQTITTGNISSVADERLRGSYEITSMWKVIDTAMACTADTSDRRPTMAAVVAQLKESLALEEARKDSGVGISFTSDTAALVSTFAPSAR